MGLIRSIPGRVFAFYWGEGIADDVPALTYYLILSLAPFALGVAALEALLLDYLSALEVARQLNRFLPEAVHGDVQRLVTGTRDDSPLLIALAVAAMLWTSSGGIGVIERCLSRMLGGKRFNMVVGRLRNVGLGLGVAAAVILASLTTSAITDLNGVLQLGNALPGWVLVGVNTVGSVLLFAAIYRYAPGTRMRWRSALLGGLPAGVGLQVVPAVIGLYVGGSAGFAAVRLFLVLAVILLGLYVIATLVLVGGGLAARAERRARRRATAPRALAAQEGSRREAAVAATTTAP